MRKAVQILKDLIPEKVYEEEEVEKMIRINAIWATISVALSKMVNLAVLCPTGNDSLDEQAAAKWGFCRESCDYEDFAESLFAKTLNDLEKFTTAKEDSSDQQLRFAPNLQNREVQGVSKTKIRKSSAKHPAKNSKPSSALQSSVQEMASAQEVAHCAPKVVCLNAPAHYAQLPPLPNLPPPPPPTASPNTLRAARLRAKFPGGLMKNHPQE